jgi:hypothetical protein
MLSQI